MIKQIEIVQHTTIRNMSFFIQDTTFVPLHMHSDMEIIRVVEGNLIVNTQQESFELQAGNIALFNPYQPHSCYTKSKNCLLFVLQIDPAFCHTYYPQFQKIHFETSNIGAVCTSEQLSEIETVCFHIGYNYFGQKLGFEFRCISDINRLIDHFLQAVPFSFLQNDCTIYELERRMERILSYVNHHYTEKISLTEIADAENLTANYLSHFFKNHLGQSFQEYVNTLRLEHAIYLLRNTNMKIIDICIGSGFSDNKYLNKQMKQLYHLTPLEFRRKHPPFQSESVPSSSDTAKSTSTFPCSQKILSMSESLHVLRTHHMYKCDIGNKPNRIF